MIYDVIWTLRVEADNTVDAARQALGEMRDQYSTATYLRTVNVETNEEKFFDLEELDNFYSVVYQNEGQYNVFENYNDRLMGKFDTENEAWEFAANQVAVP